MISLVCSGILLSALWYKADGEGEHHQFYSVEDFEKITSAAFKHKAEQLTYLDNVKSYVRTFQSIQDVTAAYYGMEVPA